MREWHVWRELIIIHPPNKPPRRFDEIIRKHGIRESEQIHRPGHGVHFVGKNELKPNTPRVCDDENIFHHL